jgi:hypothetical protein
MNLSRSSIWLHSFQGTFALLAKGPVCNPCLRNELSPISQEGQQLGPAPGQTEGHRTGDEPAPVTAGMLARAPRATGTRRSTWLALDKGWLK